MKTRCTQTLKIWGRKHSFELVVTCNGLNLKSWDVYK
jgi:hypothetical protein